MSQNYKIVNSWNEWDPLKHVIVGKADGTCIPAPEPALDANCLLYTSPSPRDGW